MLGNNVTTSVIESSVVAVERGPAHYPGEAPFHPGEAYPEFPGSSCSKAPNHVYAMVRNCLKDLGLDIEHQDTPDWNPVGALVPRGARILIKPNLVLHRNEGGAGTDCLFTHPSVLRAALDYAALAQPAEIVIGDAPVQGCDWNALMAQGFSEVLDYARRRGLKIRTVDFRRTMLSQVNDLKTVYTDLRPIGEYKIIDLGTRSLLEPISKDAHKFRVTMYDPRKMRDHHAPGRHRYVVARDVLDADLVLNLPKLKTHKKAGLTAALKNLVGINGNKDYLPHHRKGSARFGGDNYKEFSLTKWCAEQLLDIANMFWLEKQHAYRWATRLVYYLLVANMRLGGDGDVEGGWYGNDTVWRMCLDLNRLLLYCDREGRIANRPQRLEITIGDGVIAGQGAGPLRPDPLELGIIVASLNPAAADWITALVMGLDPKRIPIVARAFEVSDLPIVTFQPTDIVCRNRGQDLSAEDLLHAFQKKAAPPPGWRGHCEWPMQETMLNHE